MVSQCVDTGGHSAEALRFFVYLVGLFGLGWVDFGVFETGFLLAVLELPL